MQITILSLFGTISPHLETDLELAQLHLDRGEKVTMVYCDAALSFCSINPRNDLSMCRVCQQGRKKGLRFVSQEIEVIPLSEIISAASARVKETSIPDHFDDYNSLLNYEVDGRKIGAAVMSSLNYISNQARPDLTGQQELIQDAIRSGLAVYYGFLSYVEQRRDDLCYIFNGRFGEMRGAIWAWEKFGINFYTHERGHDLNSYMLFRNTLPHDTEYYKQDLDRTVAEEPSLERQAALADGFFRDRQKGIIDNWHSFTDKQKEGLLPAKWNKSTNRVVVFTSTEAEMAALPEFYGRSLYPTQREGLLRLITDLSQHGFGGVLAIRMHPNSREPFHLERDLQDIPHDFVEFIDPDSPIDSYAMLHSCDKVVSFGSTIGIEAVYWGKPSILIGRGIYEHLSGTYNPANHEEAVQLLLLPLEPKPKAPAIQFGFYQKVFGTDFVFTHATGLHAATFKGEKLVVRGFEFYLHRIGWILFDALTGGYWGRNRALIRLGVASGRRS